MYTSSIGHLLKWKSGEGSVRPRDVLGLFLLEDTLRVDIDLWFRFGEELIKGFRFREEDEKKEK